MPMLATPSSLPASSAADQRARCRAYWQQLAATTRVWVEDAPSFGKLRARVEWQSDHGPATSVVCFRADYRRGRYLIEGVDWVYDEPPDDVCALVREVVEEEAQTAHGCFAGYETSSEMHDAIDAERYAPFMAAMLAAYEAQKAVR